MKPVASAIADGVAFLLASQRTDGGFPNRMCADREMTDCRTEAAVFPSALVLGSLLDLDPAAAVAPRLPEAIDRGLDYLEAQREPDAPLWRYWAADDLMHGAVGPDLDDSAIVAHLLRRAGRQPPATRGLIEVERLDGGAFRTWPGINEPPDCVVNLNVVAYLAAVGSHETGAACSWLRQVARDGSWGTCTPYYAADGAFPYFYARALDRGARCLAEAAEPLVAHLRRELLRTPLDLALHLSTRSRLGACGDAEAALAERLRRLQRRDGGWPAAAFFRGPGPSYFGSPVLSTAMAVQALDHWRRGCGSSEDGPRQRGEVY